MFSFKEFFQIGVFSVEDDFTEQYDDGTAGFNVVLTFHYQDLEFYYIEAEITPISSGDVINYGFLSVHHFFLLNDFIKKETTVAYDPPGDRFYNHVGLYLYLNDNLEMQGEAEIQCFVNGTTLVNETISFEISFDIPINREDMRNINLMIYVLFFLYFLSIPIIPFILSLIFRPVFGVDFDKDTREKNEKFVNFLSDKAKEKRKNNGTSAPK